MKIAVDCRYLGMSGIGRVLQGFLENVDFNQHQYILIGNPYKIRKILSNSLNYEILEDNNSPFSKKGLIRINSLVNSADCLFIPNYIIPSNVKIKVYTIIHDIIFMDLKYVNRGFMDKLIKKHFLKKCLKKSKHIFSVSKFTINRVLAYFPKFKNKITLNYVGLVNKILEYNVQHFNKLNQIIYVGNIKKHKGLACLIDAFKNIKDKNTILKIVGSKSHFVTEEIDFNIKNVEFAGELSDDELLAEISKSKILIQPSEYEGFGAPPLEALYLGTNVLLSDIDVFKEVYADFGVDFFECNNSSDLTEKIDNFTSKEIVSKKIIYSKYNYSSFVDKIMEEILKI